MERLEAGAGAPLLIKDVKIGGSSRMKVLAEIVDATRCSPAALTKRIRYYEEQGADMIDLGIPLDGDPNQVKAALQIARKATNLPISIDTIKSELILAGLRGRGRSASQLKRRQSSPGRRGGGQGGHAGRDHSRPRFHKFGGEPGFGRGDGNNRYRGSCSRPASARNGRFAAKVQALLAGSSRYSSLFWSGQCY